MCTGAGIWALGQVLVKPLSNEINAIALVAPSAAKDITIKTRNERYGS